jgi:hypothetical protein
MSSSDAELSADEGPSKLDDSAPAQGYTTDVVTMAGNRMMEKKVKVR